MVINICCGAAEIVDKALVMQVAKIHSIPSTIIDDLNSPRVIPEHLQEGSKTDKKKKT